MKNGIKTLSALMLVISVAASVFTACNSENAETKTNLHSTETTESHATDYTYNDITTATKANETKYIHTVPPVPTEKTTLKSEQQTKETSYSQKENSTKKYSSENPVDELTNGLNIIAKTSPVLKGNSATVIIQGTPNAEYSIEFYKNDKQAASYAGLNDTTADHSGFASWTFTVENNCESGKRKIIIREKNSDNFLQTSITVQ